MWLPSQACLAELLERHEIPSMGPIPSHLGCSMLGGGKTKRMKEGERVRFLAAAGEEDGLPQPAQPESLQSPLIDGKYAKGQIVPLKLSSGHNRQ